MNLISLTHSAACQSSSKSLFFFSGSRAFRVWSMRGPAGAQLIPVLAGKLSRLPKIFSDNPIGWRGGPMVMFHTEVQSNDKCFYTNKHSKGGTGVPPVQAQAKACDYIK
jgi:hypothetical protein